MNDVLSVLTATFRPLQCIILGSDMSLCCPQRSGQYHFGVSWKKLWWH